MYSGQVSKYKGGEWFIRQIAIGEDTYRDLDQLRRFKGRKYSFNTLLRSFITGTLPEQRGKDMYLKLQWYAIQDAIHTLYKNGFIESDLLQYSQILRLIVNGNYIEAKEYIDGQFVQTKLPAPPDKERQKDYGTI